jgi:hypothetical protein
MYAYTTSPLASMVANSKGCSELCINDYLIENDMAKGAQSKNKAEFSKNDFQDCSEKHENKNWPTISDYPLESFQALTQTDHH